MDQQSKGGGIKSERRNLFLMTARCWAQREGERTTELRRSTEISLGAFSMVMVNRKCSDHSLTRVWQPGGQSLKDKGLDYSIRNAI